MPSDLKNTYSNNYRANLSILNERTDLHTPAFYILLGENENTKPKAYIGETENFKERVILMEKKGREREKLIIGFEVFDRTDSDDQGNPFPILKMKLR